MNKDQFKAKNEQLKAKQAKARESLSVPRISASLSARPISEPKCCECGGPGDLYSDSWGRLWCPECKAVRIEQDTQRRRESRVQLVANRRRWLDRGMPKRYRSARLRHLSRKFAAMLLANTEEGAVLYGPTGTGKSYALCALMRRYIVAGQRCQRVGYEDLCLQIRSSFQKDSCVSEKDIVDPYIAADVLFLEDLGSGRPVGGVETEFSVRVLYVLLNQRIEACKPTFVSTNKTFKNIAASFDERIASRLRLLKWISIGGQDRRSL